MIVQIPRITEHNGYDGNLIKLEISDLCPICKGPRAGKVWKGLSYDGSRRLNVDCWENACGHVDKYSDVRKEGEPVPWDTPTITDLQEKKQEEPDPADMVENAGPNREPDWHRKNKTIRQIQMEGDEHLLDEGYNKELTVEHDPDLHAPSMYDDEPTEP